MKNGSWPADVVPHLADDMLKVRGRCLEGQRAMRDILTDGKTGFGWKMIGPNGRRALLYAIEIQAATAATQATCTSLT